MFVTDSLFVDLFLKMLKRLDYLCVTGRKHNFLQIKIK